MRKPYVNWSYELKVIFVGEPAEGRGGPQKEFFSVCIPPVCSPGQLEVVF